MQQGYLPTTSSASLPNISSQDMSDLEPGEGLKEVAQNYKSWMVSSDYVSEYIKLNNHDQ